MNNEMTNAQFDKFLDTLAKLVESEAQTVDDAVKLILEAKINK